MLIIVTIALLSGYLLITSKPSRQETAERIIAILLDISQSLSYKLLQIR